MGSTPPGPDPDHGNETLYTLVRGPGGIYQFANGVASPGDTDGDGCDDLLLGAYTHGMNGSELNHTPGNFEILGREDRALETSQLEHIPDMYHYVAQSRRWIGDVNGDGRDDVVSTPYIWRRLNYESGNYLVEDRYVHVRYGGPGGIDPDAPPVVIDARPGDANATTQNDWVGPAGVGDVNGDGYDDLFVTWFLLTGDNMSIIDGELKMYFGGEAGISTSPNWTVRMAANRIDFWWGVVSIRSADINGDGHSDVMFLFYAHHDNRPFINIHYGHENGIYTTPERTVARNTVGDNWNFLLDSGDLNGDQYDDLVVFDVVEFERNEDRWLNVTIKFIKGAPGTGQLNASQNITFETEGWLWPAFGMADLNGDGLDDLYDYKGFHDGVYRLPLPAPIDYYYMMNLTLRVRFNLDGHISEVHDWQHTIGQVNNSYVSYQNVAGDFDGDGHEDIAIALQGYEYNAGGLLVVWGDQVLDPTKLVTVEAGPVLYAGYRAYDLTVNADPLRSPDLPARVNLVLDPSGIGVDLECSVQGGTPAFSEAYDPRDHVRLTSTRDDLTHDVANGTSNLHFRVLFNWTWPLDNEVEMSLSYVFLAGSPVTVFPPRLFRVEPDLRLVGEMVVTSQLVGPLEEGDWVRSGDNLTVTGPVVVYEGTVDVSPPDGTCAVRLVDDDGDSSSQHNSQGVPVDLTIQADEGNDDDETLTLSIIDAPPGAEVTGTMSFSIGVDGLGPELVHINPPEGVWQRTGDLEVTALFTDRGGSGIDPSSVSYAYTSSDPPGVAEFTKDDIQISIDGTGVTAKVQFILADGDDHVVIWRLSDLAGNRLTTEPHLIKVDSVGVMFTESFPDPEVWHSETGIVVGITISDLSGSGVMASSIAYRVSTDGLDGFDPWVTVEWSTPTSDARVIIVVRNVKLSEGSDNYVQWKAMDVAGNGYSESPAFIIRVDGTAPTFHDFEPAADVYMRGPEVTCSINVSDDAWGSGVDLASVEYRFRTGGGEMSEWEPVGIEGTGHGTVLSLTLALEEGPDNAVQFRALDVAGNGPATSDEHTVSVDSSPPTFRLIGPFEGVRQERTTVTIVYIVDDGLTDVSIYSIQYRFGVTGEDSLGEWTDAQAVRDKGAYRVQSVLELWEGPDNVYQLRASDLTGNPGLSEVLHIYVNRPPVIVVRAPMYNTQVEVGTPVELDATGTSDPDGDPLTYLWRVDDVIGVMGEGPVQQTILSPGEHRLTLVVEDGYGGVSTETIVVNVVEPPPRPPPPEDEWALSTAATVGIVLAVVAASIVLAWVLLRRRGA